MSNKVGELIDKAVDSVAIASHQIASLNVIMDELQNIDGVVDIVDSNEEYKNTLVKLEEDIMNMFVYIGVKIDEL